MIRGPVELIITTLKENGNLDYRTNQSLQLLEKYNLELITIQIDYFKLLLKIINFLVKMKNPKLQSCLILSN